jgi:hypothetical protein
MTYLYTTLPMPSSNISVVIYGKPKAESRFHAADLLLSQKLPDDTNCIFFEDLLLFEISASYTSGADVYSSQK